jgi:hypothetical protein
VSKTLLVLLFVAAVSSSALAETAKARSGAGLRQSPATEQGTSDKAAKGSGQSGASDPYWTPCDYYSARDPNGCGW